jgi:hypothetical protein
MNHLCRRHVKRCIEMAWLLDVRWPIVRLFATALSVFGTYTSASAQDKPSPELRASHAATPPKIDGILDDAVWSGEALPMDKWVSYNPMRGEPALQRTSVWVAYDEKAIYIAFRCYDTEPDRIRTTIAKRDNAWNDDWVAVSLDSSRTGQVAYHMFVNPSGIQMDALNSGANGEDTAPDWVWDSAGKIDNDGYVVEMRLPLESIRFKSGTDVRMGIMFFRRISRVGVSWSWPEMTPGQWVFETHVPVVFSELRQRRVFEVIPSATFSHNEARVPSGPWLDAINKSDFGASIKYGLTSTVTLDTTINPDFSQVESDAFEVEVNQRFPVFFSEKRPFFMEGMGLFNLAGTGTSSIQALASSSRGRPDARPLRCCRRTISFRWERSRASLRLAAALETLAQANTRGFSLPTPNSIRQDPRYPRPTTGSAGAISHCGTASTSAGTHRFCRRTRGRSKAARKTELALRARTTSARGGSTFQDRSSTTTAASRWTRPSSIAWG